MAKKKNEPTRPVAPIEELTEAMHATFFVSDEDDRMHRVWSAMRIYNAVGYPETLEKALSMQQVTMADYEKYKDTWPIQG